MAAATHPIHVKAAVRIDRNLHWRGGMLGELWKLKGPQSWIRSYRDVTMVEQDAKPYGAHNGPTSIDVVRRIVLPTALGYGHNDGACDRTVFTRTSKRHSRHFNVRWHCLMKPLETKPGRAI